MSNIFENPRFGWTEWHVNDHKIGPISYLDDVVEKTCEICMKYLILPEDRRTGFNIEFEAEGYCSGIVQIGEYFYAYDTTGGSALPVNNLVLLSGEEKGEEFVLEFLSNAISDFEEEPELWAQFPCCVVTAKDEGEMAKYHNLLMTSARYLLEQKMQKGQKNADTNNRETG